MNTNQLCKKLPAAERHAFMESGIWAVPAALGLKWQEAVSSLAAVRSAWHSPALMSEARAVLGAFIAQYGAEAAEEDVLVDRLRKLLCVSGTECRSALSALRQAGLLFAVSPSWGERLWFLPSDSLPLWLSAVVTEPLSPLHEEEVHRRLTTEARTLLPVCRPFSLQLLSACAQLDQVGLSTTSNGLLPKKALAAFVESAELDEALLRAFGVHATDQGNYPLVAAFLIEAVKELELLEVSRGELSWNRQALERWLSIDYVKRDRELISWCAESIFSTAGYSHYFAAVFTLQSRGWYSSTAVLDWLAEHGMLRGEKQAADKLLQCCRLLHTLGWLELIGGYPAEADDFMFRLRVDPVQLDDVSSDSKSSSDVQESLIYIQPGGELLADPQCSFTVRWELEHIAVRCSDEPIAVYKMTAQSLTRALRSGRTREAIERFLAEASGAPLDWSVAALLEEWTGRLDHESDRKQAGRSRLAVKWLTEDQLFNRRSFHKYKLAAVQANESRHHGELYESLPVMWTKQLRSYHHSTRKEMMERALHLDIPLELRLNGGMVLFVPERLEQCESGWWVQGLLRGGTESGEARLTPDMWEEMKLIIPNGSARTSS